MNTEHLSDTHLANELLKILKEAFKNYENPIENYWRTTSVLVMLLAGISERERQGSTTGWLFYFNNLIDGVLLPVQERKKNSHSRANEKAFILATIVHSKKTMIADFKRLFYNLTMALRPDFSALEVSSSDRIRPLPGSPALDT